MICSISKKHCYFLDKNRKPIVDKNYKDKDGNDIRMPKTINNEKPIYEIDENGHSICVNQIKGKNGKLCWMKKKQ